MELLRGDDKGHPYLLNAYGDWIDLKRNVQPADVYAALDREYEGKWDKPVLAIGCKFTGAGNGERRKSAVKRGTNCCYATFYDACFINEKNYENDVYSIDYTRHGCIFPAWKLKQLEERCKILYDAVLEGFR